MSARARMEGSCGPQTTDGLISDLDDYRAEVLREAAEIVLKRVAAWEGMSDQAVAVNRERVAIANSLRHMADEAVR